MKKKWSDNYIFITTLNSTKRHGSNWDSFQPFSDLHFLNF